MHKNKINNESNLGKLRVRHNDNGDTLEEEWRKYRDEVTKYRPKVLYIRMVSSDEENTAVDKPDIKEKSENENGQKSDVDAPKEEIPEEEVEIA